MKFAVVSGASRGIGAATVRALRSRSWEVLGLARSPAPPEFDADPGVHWACLNLSDLSALGAYIDGPLEQLPAEKPRRVALINNAGMVEPVTPTSRTTPAEWSRALHLNIAAPALLTGYVLRRFREMPLRVVDVSSGAATTAYPAWGAYCASKAALRMLGQVIACETEQIQECRHPDFALVSYSPGVVATAMQEHLRGVDPHLFPKKDRFVALHDEGQLLQPEQPAQEIANLAESDDLPRWSETRCQP